MAGKTSDRVADQRKEIVDHVIEEMGKGGFSWLKPWADSASPHNPVTGSTYHGRNRMHLAVMAIIKGYNDPRWVTFNQAKKVGWKLQKGAKSCIVEKWKMYPVKDSSKEKDKSSPASDDTQNLRMIPRCVGYWSVFNASQFDGVPPLPQLNRNDDIEIGRLADDVKDSSRCPVREAPGNEAYYMPVKDMIAIQNGGLDAAELDSLAANIFMDMDWLQMCTDLAEQMTWECSTERSELAEMLWNGDPEQGIAALEDVAVDDDDCIKQEWMGYKPGTPRFEIWKDFETNFSKDGVSLCELSGFDDYKVEYKDPGPTLSESEFDKLFGSDVREGNVQKDVSDVSWDDPGSEDER